MSRILFVTLVMIALSLGCGYGNHNYMTNPGGPSITMLMPNTAFSGGSAFTLTVAGSGFGTDATVYWNAIPQASSYVTGNQVTAQISSGEIANPGTIAVYVRSGGKNSNSLNFMVQ